MLLPVLYVRKRLPSFLFVKELRSLSQEVGNKGVIKSFFPSSFPFQWKDRFDAEHSKFEMWVEQPDRHLAHWEGQETRGGNLEVKR